MWLNLLRFLRDVVPKLHQEDVRSFKSVVLLRWQEDFTCTEKKGGARVTTDPGGHSTQWCFCIDKRRISCSPEGGRLPRA
jgi:hypothetical protein